LKGKIRYKTLIHDEALLSIPVTTQNDRKPSTTDYMAAAVLSYGIIYFWVELKAASDIPWMVAWIIFYLAGVIPSYLVCKRTTRNQLGVGIKTVFISWAFVVFSLSVFLKNSTTSFFVLLLILFLIGGVTSAYITMKERLKPKRVSTPTKI
jgi:hypothetical protein